MQDFGEQDFVELSPNGQSASAEFHYSVDFEKPVNADSTLAKMALEQGDGKIKHSVRGVLKNSYVKQAGVWKIEHSSYRFLTA